MKSVTFDYTPLFFPRDGKNSHTFIIPLISMFFNRFLNISKEYMFFLPKKLVLDNSNSRHLQNQSKRSYAFKISYICSSVNKNIFSKIFSRMLPNRQILCLLICPNLLQAKFIYIFPMIPPVPFCRLFKHLFHIPLRVPAKLLLCLCDIKVQKVRFMQCIRIGGIHKLSAAMDEWHADSGCGLVYQLPVHGCSPE